MAASLNHFYKGLNILTKTCGAIAFISFLIGLTIKNEILGTILIYVFCGSFLLFVLGFISFSILKIFIKIKNKIKERRFKTYYKSIPDTLLEKEKELATNFEEWYSEEKNNIVNFLVQDKKKAWKINILQSIVFVINIAIGIVLIYLFVVKNFYFDYVLILINAAITTIATLIPTLFIQLIWHYNIKQKLLKKIYYEDNINFKQKIIATLLKTFSKNLKYQPEQGISRDEFFESMFGFKSIDTDRYYSEDLISTKNDDSIKIAECTIESKRRIGSSTSGITYYKLLFHGFIAIIKPETNNKKWLIVGPHVKSLLEKTDNIIKMENKLYDALYLTFSNDPIFARKVLTPKFIELLLLFHYYAEGKDCYFSFVGNKVFIALNSTSRKSESFLEFEGKTSISKEKLFYYYKILNIFTSFKKELAYKF